MKLFISKLHNYTVEDENKYGLATFRELEHALLFCNAMFLAGRVEEVYGLDGKLFAGSIDDLVANMEAVE